MPRTRGKRTIACQTDTVYLSEDQVENIVSKRLGDIKRELEALQHEMTNLKSDNVSPFLIKDSEVFMKLQSEISDLKSTDEKLTKDSDALNDLQQAAEFHLEQLQEEMTTKFENIEQHIEKTSNRERKVCEALQSELKTQSSNIDVIQQQLKSRNVVVVGLHEEDDDSIKEQIVTLAKDVMGMLDIKITDIEEAYRLGRKKEKNQPRNLLIKFKTKKRRDDFYKRRKRTPNSSDVSKNIYVNEDLTLHRARLYHDTRKLVKRGKLAFTWTQQGNVMIRVTEDSNPTAVYSTEDLQTKLGSSDYDNFESTMEYETSSEVRDSSSDED